MKALLISPENQSVEAVDINSLDDIKELIGFDTLTSDAVGDEGDRVFFDEECFLRQTSGRFQIDSLIPISGKAVIVGGGEDDDTLNDALTAADDLSERIKYL